MRRARPTRTRTGGSGRARKATRGPATRCARHIACPQGCAARSLTLMQLNTLCVKKASRQCFTTDAQR